MSWLLGPEIGHNNLAKAIGIALASGAEIYGVVTRISIVRSGVGGRPNSARAL
jgi:hypothetical protein